MLMCRISAENSSFMEIEFIKECKYTCRKCMFLVAKTYIFTNKIIGPIGLVCSSFFAFLSKNHDFSGKSWFSRNPWKYVFFDFRVRKSARKLLFSTEISIFPKNIELQLQIDIFTLVVLRVVPEILCSKLKSIDLYIIRKSLILILFISQKQPVWKFYVWRKSFSFSK